MAAETGKAENVDPPMSSDGSISPTRLAAPNHLAATAWAGIIALTVVNLLNYIDRFIVTALLPSIQAELTLTDAQGGALGSVFIIVYLVTSPVFGWLGDRGARKVWLALGVGLWSLATGLAGFARGFVSLAAARATVGVGEGAYGTISPALIADYCPPAQRGRVMAVFFFAIPAGTALGYLLGGQLGAHFGWRAAFFAVGAPGLIVAASLLFLREPARGRFDRPEERGRVPLLAGYRELIHNELYLWTVAGYTAYTFAIGGLAFWTPSYLMRVRGFPQADGMLVFGGITVVTGALGTLLGGNLGDRLQARTRHGYTILNVGSTLVGALLALLAVASSDTRVFLILLAGAELFLFASTGPVNALIVGCVRPGVRATASGVAIFSIHILGDSISPTLIGMAADARGLAWAIFIIPAVFLLAAVLWAGSFRCGSPKATPARDP